MTGKLYELDKELEIFNNYYRGKAMNIRQKYELKALAADGCVNLADIVKIFGINMRTVRYDFKTLEEYLFIHTGKNCIHIYNNQAKAVESERENILRIAESSHEDYYSNILTAEERALLILYDLCWRNNCITIQEMAEKYYVSRSTINTDIKEVKSYCEKEGIRLISKRGKGIFIEAGEADRRKYLAKIIREYTAVSKEDSKFDISIYRKWFDEKELVLLKRIITEVEEEFETFLDDIAFEALAIHVALSIERYRENAYYADTVNTKETDKNTLQYRMAKELLERVNDRLEIKLPESEVFYVSVHMGAKTSAIIKPMKYGDVFLEYYCLRVISKVSKRIENNLTSDEKLYDSLFQHLSACEYRMKNGLLLENPLKEELIKDYPKLYEIVKEVFEDIAEVNIINPSDDEMAYIMLHFAAAINRKKQNARRRIHAVVVCSTGIGTAELVVTELNRHFKLDIVGTVARHQLDNFLSRKEADIIITTVPLETKRPCVRVSPVLKKDDIVRISRQLLDMGFNIEEAEEPEGNISRTALLLKRLLQEYPSAEDEKLLIKKIEEFPEKIKKEKAGYKYMLSELVNEKSIRLNVSCGSWQEVVREAGKILIEKGDITSEYVKAVIDNVNEMGPYIVITKGVALPHATNKVGVNKTAMSLLTLKEPVNFGNESNDPVKYVFMLAAKDADSHLDALQDLVEFLEKKEFFDVMDDAEEPESIISYIKSNEMNS